VSLLLCDDSAIRALNREYRDKDEPTDVLSFPQEEGPPMPLGFADEEIPHTLGDVILSVDTARRQAGEHGRTLQEEVEALLTHGVLHLLGYDHEEPDEREVMRARENEFLGDKSVWAKMPEETGAEGEESEPRSGEAAG
jgi:probable rRNA maturation factor